MRRSLSVVWLVVAIAGCARPQAPGITSPCHGARISNSNGMQIGLTSGLAYQAYPGAQQTLATWAPLDKVSVCRIGGDSVQITNLGKQDQSVKAYRIYPVNSGQI